MYFGQTTGRLRGQVWKLSYPNFAKWPAKVHTTVFSKRTKVDCIPRQTSCQEKISRRETFSKKY